MHWRLITLGPNVITFRTLLHLGPNVITFRTLLHLGPNVITFRTLLHLGQLLHLGLQQAKPSTYILTEGRKKQQTNQKKKKMELSF